MTSVAKTEQRASTEQVKKIDPLDNNLIPETFQELRREPDGSLGPVALNKYARGRVLGKVSLLSH